MPCSGPCRGTAGPSRSGLDRSSLRSRERPSSPGICRGGSMTIVDPRPTGVRRRPRPSRDQTLALRSRMVRFQEPATVLEVVRPCVGLDVDPASMQCALKSVHPDRFVVQVRLRERAGGLRAFALKVYSDDFGESMWTLARSLAPEAADLTRGLCLPIRYLPQWQTLVFPWVEGPRLSDVVDD